MLATVARVKNNGQYKISMKARPGREKKWVDWVETIHMNWKDEFDRLRKLGIKFKLINLRVLAMGLSRDSQIAAYRMSKVDQLLKLFLHTEVDAFCINSFTELLQIMCRADSGKYRSSPQKKKSKSLSLIIWALRVDCFRTNFVKMTSTMLTRLVSIWAWKMSLL